MNTIAVPLYRHQPGKLEEALNEYLRTPRYRFGKEELEGFAK